MAHGDSQAAVIRSPNPPIPLPPPSRHPALGHIALGHIALVMVLAAVLTVGVVPVVQAAPNPAVASLNTGFAKQRAGDGPAAKVAFERALKDPATAQRAHMALGYLNLRQGDAAAARQHFVAAKLGDDAALAGQARAALRTMPRHLWADLYFEGYGWHRLTDPSTTNLVPLLRGRLFYRPSLDHDVHLYGFAQVSRDTHSRASGPNGYPLIYADNTALVGAGALWRLWDGKIGLFARTGPAMSLLKSGAPTWAWDGRAGVFSGAQSDLCTARSTGLCLQGYGEAVWVNRFDVFDDPEWRNGFDNNVVVMARLRADYGVLMTGPVRWSPYVEARGLVDRNGNYYNNLIDAGVGHRWRLLGRVPLDLLIGVHAGTYTGRTKDQTETLPDPYIELRTQFGTYLQF
ncbi:MAG: hypothetical protein KC502_10015 [Myxococcales bacterium]|nr:hypothetical protein [Myxococcales bacterium]